jgi:23S rRNA pseudouridine1911/1915/1917 synthase
MPPSPPQFPSEPDEQVIVGEDLLLPSGRVDPEALLRASGAESQADEDEQLARVQFILRRDLKKRLDKYLTDRIGFMSRNQLQRLIDKGGVWVNQRQPKSSTLLRQGDVVEVLIPPPPSTQIQPEEIPLEVLYEDEHLIVINKSPDIIVHPARSHLKGTMVNALAWHFQQATSGEDTRAGRPGDTCGDGRGIREVREVRGGAALSSVGAEFARPGVVHRLDRHTSGVIVFAKQDEAHWKLAHQFEHRRVDKRYLAVVHGRIEPDIDVIDLPIGPHPSREKGYREKYVVRHDEQGRHAVTIYRVREHYGEEQEKKTPVVASMPRLHPNPRTESHAHPGPFTLVELELKTGRTHQIRVHLSHLGWSIVGDDMYGGRPVLREDGTPVIARQALHATLLGFEHPITRQPMVFTAPLRGDMAELITRLRAVRPVRCPNPPGATVDLEMAIGSAPPHPPTPPPR